MATQITPAMQNAIAQNYIAILGRNPDPAGFKFWVDVYANADATPAALTSITNGFGNSAEFRGTYGGMSTESAISLMYTNVLLRAADAGGLAYWTNYANNLISSGQTITNAYAQTGAQIIYNAASQGNSDAAGIIARTATAVASGTATATTTYTLGTAGETISGSNLVVNAYYNQTANSTDSTLTALDTLTGTGGVNTLNLSTAGTPVTLNGASINGFQVINLRATAATGDINLSTSAISGLTNFNVTGTGAVQVSNLNSGAAYGLTGNGATVFGAQQVGYAAGATTGTINLSGGVGPTGTTAPAITLTGAGITTATINSTGAANTVGAVSLAAAGTTTTVNINATTALTTAAITAAVATTYTLTGAGAINIAAAALANTVTTVNAAATTGGVTVVLGGAVTQTVTGGSGNDVITTGAILTTGSVNAGTGTDTLIVSAVNQVNTSALAAKYTGFETLRNAVDNATLDASLIAGITTIQLTGATANLLTGLSSAQTIQAFGTVGTVGLTLTTPGGTSDALNLVLGTGLTTAVAANTGALTINGYETLNASTNAGPTATAGANRTSTIASFTADSLTAINLTGTAFTLTNIATAKAVAINGSALVGDGATTSVGLTVGGSAFAGSTITGSNVRDLFTIGAIGSTYNTGTGNDSVSATQTIAAGSTINFGTGTTDTLALTDAGGVTVGDTTFANVTGADVITLAAATSVSWTVGGFANTVATGNGGVLSVTTAGITDLAATAINAASMTAGNSLKLVATLTDDAGNGNTAAFGVTGSAGADSITVTGGAGYGGAITISSALGTVGKTVDLSGVSAAGAISITTGAGVDTISSAALASTIKGGAGADLITLAANAQTLDYTTANQTTTTAYDLVSTFGVNSDIIDIAGTALLTAAQLGTSGWTVGTGFATKTGATLSDFITAFSTSLTAGAVAFNDGANTYVAYSDGTGAVTTSDQIVQLTGISTATAIATVGAANTIIIA